MNSNQHHHYIGQTVLHRGEKRVENPATSGKALGKKNAKLGSDFEDKANFEELYPRRLNRKSASLLPLEPGWAWLAAVLVILVATCCIGIALGQSEKRLESYQGLDQSPTDAEVGKFLAEVEWQSFGATERDARGWPASLTLVGVHAEDRNLILASRLTSLRNLVVHGRNAGTACTRNGAASLQALTNLTSVKLLCTGSLQPGVFQEVCRLGNLRELQLTAAMPPSDEYLCLSNLHGLRRLGIANCTNFGDAAIGVLTNLTELEAFELVNNAVSDRGTNVLKGLSHLKETLFIK